MKCYCSIWDFLWDASSGFGDYTGRHKVSVNCNIGNGMDEYQYVQTYKKKANFLTNSLFVKL